MRGTPDFSSSAYERKKVDPFSELLDELKRDGIKVTLGSPFTAGPVRYAGFPQGTRTFVKGAADAAKHYLSGALIEDSFAENHDARRAWRSDMEKKFGKTFKELDDANKLRMNVIGNVYSYVVALNEMAKDQQSPEAEALRSITSDLPSKKELDAYSMLPLAEKRKIVTKMEAVAGKVVALFSPK